MTNSLYRMTSAAQPSFATVEGCIRINMEQVAPQGVFSPMDDLRVGAKTLGGYKKWPLGGIQDEA